MLEDQAVRHIGVTMVCGMQENVPEQVMVWMRPDV